MAGVVMIASSRHASANWQSRYARRVTTHAPPTSAAMVAPCAAASRAAMSFTSRAKGSSARRALSARASPNARVASPRGAVAVRAAVNAETDTILVLGCKGAFYTLVPIRPRRRGSLAFNPDTPRRLSAPTDAFV
eukprot:31457-Pelagococcus_subviridis.AAC.12